MNHVLVWQLFAWFYFIAAIVCFVVRNDTAIFAALAASIACAANANALRAQEMTRELARIAADALETAAKNGRM